MRILIVDDNPEVVELMAAFLADIGPHDSAKNGIEAVERVADALKAETPYDLICLDIKMPLKDGRQALADIRALEQKYDIQLGDGAKIIMTTALKDRPNVIGAFWDDGCDGYLVKPFSRGDLMETLRKLDLIPAV